MLRKKLLCSLILLSSCSSEWCMAGTTGTNAFQHSLYLGAMGGYGSTTWDGLVPSQKNANAAILLGTPSMAEEGGHVWGVFAGYELTPYFALESSYMKYPNAQVYFDPTSLFAFDNDGKGSFESKTETVDLMAKIMLVIPKTRFRVYSSAGIADTHRTDMLMDSWRLSPAFGVGLNFHMSDRLMGEIAGKYTAGFGESQINPSDTYIPFLYSVSFKLAYCF